VGRIFEQPYSPYDFGKQARVGTTDPSMRLPSVIDADQAWSKVEPHVHIKHFIDVHKLQLCILQ